jgi:hypothetical protein
MFGGVGGRRQEVEDSIQKNRPQITQMDTDKVHSPVTLRLLEVGHVAGIRPPCQLAWQEAKAEAKIGARRSPPTFMAERF